MPSRKPRTKVRCTARWQNQWVTKFTISAALFDQAHLEVDIADDPEAARALRDEARRTIVEDHYFPACRSRHDGIPREFTWQQWESTFFVLTADPPYRPKSRPRPPRPGQSTQLRLE